MDDAEVNLDEKATSSNEATKIELQRIYIKEQHCKLSHSPQLFKEEWKPELSMEMQINNVPLEENLYEVVLQFNVVAKNNQLTAVTIELQQGGIFLIQGFTEEQRKAIFASYIPSILYPYARKAISSLSVDGSIPPITIAPVNFEGIWQQQVKQKEKEEEEKREAVLN